MQENACHQWSLQRTGPCIRQQSLRILPQRWLAFEEGDLPSVGVAAAPYQEEGTLVPNECCLHLDLEVSVFVGDLTEVDNPLLGVLFVDNDSIPS